MGDGCGKCSGNQSPECTMPGSSFPEHAQQEGGKKRTIDKAEHQLKKIIDVVEVGLSVSGFNVIPKAKSFKIKDLFEIFQEEFNLKFKVTKPRISEKIDEIMVSSEEVPRLTLSNDSKHFLMHHTKIYNDIILPNKQYSSRDVVVTKGELKEMLIKNNYYKLK